MMTTTFDAEELESDVHIISIKGDLDAPGGLAIKDELQKYVATHSQRCVVDLSGVDYLSSYGLRVLLTVAQILQREGGALHLAAPNQRVMDVLATSGYNTLFPVYDSLDDAKAKLGI